jgi:GxxExxY protein
MKENDIARSVLGTCLEIHRELGPGLLESVYEEVLTHELNGIGLKTLRQVPIPVRYRSVELSVGFRADLIVGDAVLIELKSVECLLPVHKKHLRLGLLVNFNSELLRDGFFRVVNGL